MADVKISELNGASTPLAGTELVPLVQNGETKKVAVSEIGVEANPTSGILPVNENGVFVDSVVSENSGNVGIGTTAPSEKLHVVGDMNLYNPSLTSQINFRNIVGANYIKSDGYSTNFGLRGNTGSGVFVIEDSLASTQDIRIKPTTSGWDFSSRGVAGVDALLTIDSVLNVSNKTNVGIGTTSPQAPLHIYQPSGTGLLFSRLNHDSIDLSLEGSNRFVITNATDGLDLMTLMFNSGNVGIGTSSPSEKLDVNGTLKAQGYKSSDGSAGVTQNVNTGGGNTLVIKNGIITQVI